MTDPRKAYVVYKCAHGWCLEPFEVTIRKSQDQTYAFSTLTELLEFLTRKEEEPG